MHSWVLLVLLYGIIKGFREPIKKKAMSVSSVIEVLFFYSLFGFIFILPFSHDVFSIPPVYYGYIFFKSSIIFLAWICGFKAIKKLPVSLYGVMDSSRMLFAMMLGMVVLGERLSANQAVGCIIVLVGLVMVNLKKSHKAGDVTADYRYVWLVLASCFLNAMSGLTDKMIMKGNVITSSQLQFWYMLFITSLYLAYILISRTKINFKTLKNNYWIILLSLLFVIADRALFIANENPDSKVTIMTLIKQSSVIITILMGKLIYKEKGIVYRLICAGLIISGIVLSTI